MPMLGNVVGKVGKEIPVPGSGKPALPKPSMLTLGHEMMISGMLSGPQTHMFNMTDNAVKSILYPLETATRGILSVGRKPENKTYLREAVYEAFGQFTGWGKSLKYAGARIKTRLPGQVSESPEQTLARQGHDPGLMQATKTGLHERNITGEKVLGTSEGLLAKSVDALGALINIPGTALNHADVMGKIGNYNRLRAGQAANLHAQGKFKTYDEAWNAIIEDPNMSKKMVELSKEAVYQGDPDSYLKWILSDSADGVPGLRWVVPFRRAIANLLEHTIERTPLIVTSPTLMKKLMSKDPVIADTARSKFVFGMTALTGIAMMTDSMLTGAAPDGKPNRDAWLRVFKEEDTLNIGDESFNLRNFGVYGNMMRVIARYQQWVANKPIPEFEKDASGESERYMKEFGQFINPIVDVMYDNHWGKNMVEFFALISEAVEEQDGTRLAKFFERNASRMIPVIGTTPSINVAKKNFPYSTRSDRVGDILAAQVDGLRELIPVDYTWDGHQMLVASMMKGETGHKLMENKYGPLDKIDEEIVRVGAQLPTTKRYMVMPSAIKGKSIRKFFSPQEWKDFNTLRLTGFAGMPGIKEFMKTSLLDTPYYQDKLKHKQFKAWEIEAHYGIYSGMMTEYFKGTTSSGTGIGTRLLDQYKSQIEVLRNEYYGDKR